MKFLYLIPLWVCLLPAAVQAQGSLPEQLDPEDEEPSSSPALRPLQGEVPSQEESKSPQTAFALSLGTTLVSYGVIIGGVNLFNHSSERSLGTGLIALGVVGAAVGPSVGHLYTGETGHAAITSSLRIGFPIAGAILFDAMAPSGSDLVPLILGTTVGVAASLGLTLYDIIDAPLSASRAKKRESGRGGPSRRVSLVPAPLLSPDGTTRIGLFAAGSF